MGAGLERAVKCAEKASLHPFAVMPQENSGKRRRKCQCVKC